MSKVIKATGDNLDPQSTVCGSNGECIIHHAGSGFKAEEVTPYDCDSEFSKKYFQGAVDSGLLMSFGHVSDVGFAAGITKP